MDDFDIYGDLHDIEKEAHQERQEVQELERKIADLQAQVLAKEQEKQAIVEKNVILSENISSLLLTAKAELKRKDTIIADLRRQCDDTVFRRKHVHFKEVHRVAKCTQTSYVRQVHIGVQVEKAEDGSVGRTKKNDGGKEHDRDRERDRPKDRDREKSSYRERDRVRERDRHRDREKSQGVDRDHDRFRERDRNKDWHRDREKAHARQRERYQTGDRYRTRDSSGHRNNNERSEERIRECDNDLDRQIAKELQQRYQHDLKTRCEPRVVRTATKSTEQKDKPLRNDRKSIHQEDSVHSNDRKTKMQTRENVVTGLADRKVRAHTPVSQSTTCHSDAIINRNEEIPLIKVVSALQEEKAVTDQPLHSGEEYRDTIELAKETDSTALLVSKPVGQTAEIHSETDASVSNRLIDDCGIAEKNAVDFGQTNYETDTNAFVLDNPTPSSIPTVIETVSDTGKDVQCHKDQQRDVCVTQQTEIMCFENTVDRSIPADCGKLLIDTPQRLTYKTDESTLVWKSNQKESHNAYESVEDATIFEEMLDVCGEAHTIEEQEAIIDSKATDEQVTSSSFLENVLEGVEDARNKSHSNINFVSDNTEIVDSREAVKQSECIPKEHRDICVTTIVDVPLEDKKITYDSSDHVQTDGSLACSEQRPETSKSKRKACCKVAKPSKSSGDGVGTTNIGDTADKTSAKITVDDHFLQEKSYNVEDTSVWKDHLMSLDDRADEQTSNVEKNRVDITTDYASTNDGSNLLVDGGGSKKEWKQGAPDVHLNSKIIEKNAQQDTSGEVESRALGETTESVPNPSTTEPTQQKAQTFAPIRLEENPVECLIEHLDKVNEPASNITQQQGMRIRSKSVCLEKVTYCHQADDEACDIIVCSPSKTEKGQLTSKTRINLRNHKSNDVLSDHGTPSKHGTRTSSAHLNQRDKAVPLANYDGHGSIRDRLRKMFCSDRPQKSSRCYGTKKRRLSLDSAPSAIKKQKAENDRIDDSKSSSSSASKLSDTFFSSIFLPVVSSLDSIHLKTESPTSNRACPIPCRSNMPSMVVVHSPIKFEHSPQRSPKGQATTQALMDSLLLSLVKDEDAVELEQGQECIAKDNEVDHIRFSPQHLLASSTPLIVKPQSRLHHSTSSVPAMPSDGGACTGAVVTPNSKTWTAPLEHPMPSGVSSVTADKLSRREITSCKDKHNRKPKEQKRTKVFVVNEFKSKRPESTTISAHRQSGDEGQICMVNTTDDRILLSDTASKHSDKDRFNFSPASIDKKIKKRRDSVISNIDEKLIISGNTENLSCKKDLPPGVFKTPDVVKSGNRLQHTPRNSKLANYSANESNEFPISQSQNQSPVTAKLRDDGTPLTSRKRSRTSTSPKRRKIDVTEGEEISNGISNTELSPATNNKKKRRSTAVDEIREESLPTDIFIRPRYAHQENNANEDVDVHVGQNKAISSVRNLSANREATVETIVDKGVTSAPPIEMTSTVPPASLVSVESLCHTRSPNSIQQATLERTVSTVKTSVEVPHFEPMSGQGPDTTTSAMSPLSGSATHKMCNFSLNLSLASTATVETDTSVQQKSETPVRFVREMRIVKENPKLLRVYINRRGD